MPAPVWGAVPILVVALLLIVVIVKLLSNMSWKESPQSDYKSKKFHRNIEVENKNKAYISVLQLVCTLFGSRIN